MHNVIVVHFPETSVAYQGFSALKTEAAEGRVGLKIAGIVERHPTEGIRVVESVDTKGGAAIGAGSLIGAVVGIFGGPIGVLLGLGAGSLIGANVERNRAIDIGTGVSILEEQIVVGETVVIADVEEYATEVLDKVFGALGGQIARFDRETVVAQISAAEAATQAAREEAARVMNEKKKEHEQSKAIGSGEAAQTQG